MDSDCSGCKGLQSEIVGIAIRANHASVAHATLGLLFGVREGAHIMMDVGCKSNLLKLFSVASRRGRRAARRPLRVASVEGRVWPFEAV